jgi:hypothetical protein
MIITSNREPPEILTTRDLAAGACLNGELDQCLGELDGCNFEQRHANAPGVDNREPSIGPTHVFPRQTRPKHWDVASFWERNLTASICSGHVA